MESKTKVKILYLNIYGQTKLPDAKQYQIQDIVRHHKCDIVHLQEIDCDSSTFSQCNFLKNNFSLISNNSHSKYGTASLIKNDFNANNISFDTEGRVIMFNIGCTTFGNVYLEAGTDSISRNARENYCGEIIPNLLINPCQAGVIGGDWNCIINNLDATNNPNSKKSPNLSRFVKTFQLKDSFRSLQPISRTFSHYYTLNQQVEATRIDREYHWGEIEILNCDYIPAAFSDHMGLLVEISIPHVQHTHVPMGMPHMRIRDNVARDSIFQQRVSTGKK